MFQQLTPHDLVYALALCSGLGTIVFTLLNRSRVSPSLAIFGRWARWIFVACSVAVIADMSGYDRHPLWVLAIVGFLGWFLLETIYIWLAVGALSRSNMPLFPRYEENTRGDEWPSQERFIHLRAWLRKQGFQRVQALFARLGEHVLMRVSVYESADRKTRLSVLFFPNNRGQAATAFSLHSVAKDGVRLVTDNIFLPFGGFYPENWYLERKPWTRSLPKLYQRHLARCDAQGMEFEPFDSAPLNDFNSEQRHLEQLNRELGFLTGSDPRRATEEDEDPERITSAGRYRVWLELWTLSYFGRPRRY
jgi:hypothetical protein